MVVLVTCKNEDLIENECARVFTILKINFSDAQGQITLELVVVSARNFQTLKGSLLRSPWSDLAEFRTRPRCYECSRYLQA